MSTDDGVSSEDGASSDDGASPTNVIGNTAPADGMRWGGVRTRGGRVHTRGGGQVQSIHSLLQGE